MIIRHIGHACFRIDLDCGLSIVTDPFDPAVGYELPHTPADIVTTSHEHHDHNYVGDLAPKHLVKGSGKTALEGVSIEGFPSFHDDVSGAKRGANTIFVFEAEGLRVAHLGDLGHPLTDAQIAQLGPVDVLLIPVGGVFTIDAGQAADLTKKIGAKITVPMHYARDELSFRLGQVDDYLAAMGAEKLVLSELDPKTCASPVVVLKSGQGL